MRRTGAGRVRLDDRPMYPIGHGSGVYTQPFATSPMESTMLPEVCSCSRIQ